MDTNPVTTLAPIDYAVMAVYFIAVLGVGWLLRRVTRSSTDFFLSGRSLSAWVTGIAFISANLGAQEVIGMGASGAKYGILTSHFYWVGAIPAMVFVGLFMMPFYYGSRARSVPEYLRLRFDEKTPLASVSIRATTVWTATVSPSCTRISLRIRLSTRGCAGNHGAPRLGGERHAGLLPVLHRVDRGSPELRLPQEVHEGKGHRPAGLPWRHGTDVG
jgi:hypothetical protein